MKKLIAELGQKLVAAVVTDNAGNARRSRELIKEITRTPWPCFSGDSRIRETFIVIPTDWWSLLCWRSLISWPSKF
jgi:hypothetical protein